MKNTFRQTIQRIGKALFMHLLKYFMFLTLSVVFIVAWQNGYCKTVTGRLLNTASIAVMLIYVVSLYLFSRIYNAYSVGLCRVAEIVYSQVLTELMSAAMLYILISIARSRPAHPRGIIVMVAVQIALSIGWAWLADKIYFKLYKPKRTAIVYRDSKDLRKLSEIDKFTDSFEVVRRIKDPDCEIEELIKQLEGMEVVFVAGVNASLRNGIAKYCVENGIEGYMIPHIGDIIMSGAQHMQQFSVPIMHVSRSVPLPEYLFTKRVFDIVTSLVALIVLSPVMIVTAVAIKLCDHGPVFYKQTRLTKNGREFKIIKFRSMYVNAEKDGVARLSQKNDDRVTPVGKVIRAWRIDELPQLINILKGDMSVVGPRPERPEIAAEYEKHLSAFRMRLQVKAGLTGMAQVYGRYNTEPYSKLEMDLIYISRMSFPEDLRLIIATIKILMLRESTTGVEHGAITAEFEEDVREEEAR